MTPPESEIDAILLPLAEAESGEWGMALSGKEAFTDAPLVTEAKAALSRLIDSRVMQVLDQLTIEATETKDVKTGAIRQTVGLGYILNERRRLEAGSGEAKR